jgi:hypothetical protein
LFLRLLCGVVVFLVHGLNSVMKFSFFLIGFMMGFDNSISAM